MIFLNYNKIKGNTYKKFIDFAYTISDKLYFSFTDNSVNNFFNTIFDTILDKSTYYDLNLDKNNTINLDYYNDFTNVEYYFNYKAKNYLINFISLDELYFISQIENILFIKDNICWCCCLFHEKAIEIWDYNKQTIDTFESLKLLT